MNISFGGGQKSRAAPGWGSIVRKLITINPSQFGRTKNLNDEQRRRRREGRWAEFCGAMSAECFPLLPTTSTTLWTGSTT